MNIPKIDNRDANDVLQEIKGLAKQYVPEWLFDEENPDIGVTFSKIFASMFETTISRFNQSSYNHYVSFLNLLGAKLSPSISSNGMVTVSVVNDSKGVYIDKGTSLYASADNDEGRVFYQTVDSMYAIEAKIQSIFSTDGKEDTVVNVYDFNKDEKNEIKPFRIFDNTKNENLQVHGIYFIGEDIFKTDSKSDFLIKFYDNLSLKNSDDLQKIFSDKENAKWQYYKDDCWYDIDDVEEEKNGIHIKFDDSTELCEINGEELRCIRCMFKIVPSKGIHLTSINYSARAENLKPNSLMLDTSELSFVDFFPFGEQYNSYSSFYISSDEAFVKRGANIDIDIDMKFLKVKVNTEATNDNIKYKYIMTDMDFQTPEPADVEIEKVIWEYWNGIGWAKLYKDNANEEFFVAKSKEKQLKTLSFVCPDDIEKIIVGPHDRYFIRARILKVKNPFNVLGNYITPYVHNVAIKYGYKDEGCKCEFVFVRSNLKEKLFKVSEQSDEMFIQKELCDHPSMYICLDKPINRGPVKILFDIETGLFFNNPSLKWEYYAKNRQGKCLWQNIDVMDLTDNFSHSAIVTVTGKNDFEKTTLFGKEGYYIRVVNHDNRYSSSEDVATHPVINGVYFNTVGVVQKETHVPEYFSIENGQENKVCNLSNKTILEADVWVNEFGKLSTSEQEMFVNSRDDDIEIEKNNNGRISEIWIKWQMVDNIETAGPFDRVFEIDYNNGRVIFGNGKHGKIPTHQAQESIKIIYSMSEGSMGNIEKGEILGFSDTVPYINKVENLKPIVGGVDMETVDYAAKRISGELSGMGRIVTLNDFENCIIYNDRNICRVKCISHVNELSMDEEGVISIAVLPKNYMQGYEKFSTIKDRIEKFIKTKGSMALFNVDKIRIFETMYVEVSVSLDIVVDNYNNYQPVYQGIYKKIQEFLDPITGNFDGFGWKIGELPRKELIYNYIKSTKNVKWIKNISIFTKLITLDGKKEVDSEELRKQYFTVPIFGEPEINISVD